MRFKVGDKVRLKKNAYYHKFAPEGAEGVITEDFGHAYKVNTVHFYVPLTFYPEELELLPQPTRVTTPSSLGVYNHYYKTPHVVPVPSGVKNSCYFGEFQISDDSPTIKQCIHSWKRYDSGWSVYDYCDHCDEKRDV